MAADPIVWWELATQDAEKSVAFFESVFGWELPFSEGAGFHLQKPGAPAANLSGGGIFTMKKARLPFLALYIQVEDIDAKRDLVADNGGHIVEEPFDLDSGSRLCLFSDPSGVTWAMIQPAPEETS